MSMSSARRITSIYGSSRSLVSAILIFLIPIWLAGGLGGCMPSTMYSRRISKGDEYVQAGRMIAAGNEYRQAINLDPNGSEARLKLAAIYLDQNRVEEALDELGRAGSAIERASSQYAPNRLASLKAERYHLMARSSGKKGQAAEESKYVELCRALDPSNKACRDGARSQGQQRIPAGNAQGQNKGPTSRGASQTRSTITIDIDRDSLPEKTGLSSVIISGWVRSPNPVETIAVARQEAVRLGTTPTGESFAQKVPLHPGSNVISITVTDRLNNKSGVDIRIERTASYPGRAALLVHGKTRSAGDPDEEEEPTGMEAALINGIPRGNIDRIMGSDATLERIQESLRAFTDQKALNELLVYIDLPVRIVRVGEQKKGYWLPIDARLSDVAGTGVVPAKLLSPLRDPEKSVIVLVNSDKTETLFGGEMSVDRAASSRFFLCGARPTSATSTTAFFDPDLFEQSIARALEPNLQSASPGNMLEALEEASAHLKQMSNGGYEFVTQGKGAIAERVTLGSASQKELLKQEHYLALLSELMNSPGVSQFAVASIGKGLMRDNEDRKQSARMFVLIDDVLGGKIPAGSLDNEIIRLKGEAK